MQDFLNRRNLNGDKIMPGNINISRQEKGQ